MAIVIASIKRLWYYSERVTIEYSSVKDHWNPTGVGTGFYPVRRFIAVYLSGWARGLSSSWYTAMNRRTP